MTGMKGQTHAGPLLILSCCLLPLVARCPTINQLPREQPLEELRPDARTILGLVSAVKASHRSADEQVFLSGWSGGAHAVWYAGLKNPDVFRALAVRQAVFDPDLLAEASPLMDRSQRILV